MNETTVDAITSEASDVVVAAITVIRSEAHAVEDKGAAIDQAIIGTVSVLEEAFATGGISTVQGVSTALTASWAEVVNS